MPAPTTEPAEPERPTPSAPLSAPQARLLAAVAGLVGVLAAILVPFLPVSTTAAAITWPQGQELNADDPSIVAPLIAQTPQALDIVIPCAPLARAAADQDGTLLATMPPGANRLANSALQVTSRGDQVTVLFRANAAAGASIEQLNSPDCRHLHIFSTPTGTGAQFVGVGPQKLLPPQTRPQVDGLFTSLTTQQVKAMADAGLRADITVDNRYESTPSILKIIVMVIAVVATALALFALFCLDGLGGYRVRRASARLTTWVRSFRPRASDLIVTAILLVWLFLGAGAQDDGYILNMGRVSHDAGYLPNYYRYFGITEAPFDWYYSFLAVWSSISTALVWLHLPALIAGLASWFLVSRVVLPRLGETVVRSRWATGTAAAVFLTFWMPFCSGMRTEGIIVLGSLLTWWAAEKAITTRQLFPAALAALLAALTLTLAPQGVIGLAVLLVCARALVQVLAARRSSDGLVALVAPIVASGAVVLVVVFRDQTLMTVLEAIKVRYTVGPTIPWFQEFVRYYFLSVTTPDGAVARRIPVFLLLLALLATAAILLRRGKIDGVVSGPAWRLVGTIGLTLLLWFFIPVKWTVHFGIFAGVGAAVAALAVLAVAQSAARSTRNLTVFVTALLFAMAVVSVGYNSWPYVYDYGIAWFDRPPSLAGIEVATILLVLSAIAAALAMWQTLRLDYVTNKGMAHHRQGQPDSAGDRRRLAVSSAPIAVIAVGTVLVTLAFFAKAVVDRSPAMTALTTNVKSLSGSSCAMADQVLAEPDPNANLLTPVGGATATQALTGTGSVGFSPEGVPDSLLTDKVTSRPGRMHIGAKPWTNFATEGTLGAGTAGGTGPQTVNGSRAALPFGLDPATTPVLGSYRYPANAHLRTGWYQLPERDASPLLVFATAGAVASIDAQGVRVPGQSIVVQFGRQGGDGRFEQLGADVLPIDPGPVVANRPWRNLRVPMSAAPEQATAMRLVLDDTNLGPMQFLAITPPRAPKLQTLQDLVGSDDPTLIDVGVGAFFPCQQPMTIRHGIADVPRWRILPDFVGMNLYSKNWMAASSGGLLSISEATTRAETVPTYLRDDWHRDWGSLERLTPLAPDAVVARPTIGEDTRWGLSRTGSIRLEGK